MKREAIIVKRREEGLRLLSKDKPLSWEDTFMEIAREREDWSDLESTVADGLGERQKGRTARPRSSG